MISEPPTYEEAVSEAHRPGHEWLWEALPSGNLMCKLCGHIKVVDGYLAGYPELGG